MDKDKNKKKTKYEIKVFGDVFGNENEGMYGYRQKCADDENK